ncbi:30S ribosomal protein S8e [Candidatus Nanohalobium constans]|uniref:Small ribosomal subunit protein eS8 n=1 Tax=Candidatus Nanohalobium constans TaxID=2565781 RepID=A0A5Q0UIU9_9ARCH|nr:30S ribosomal protein S8e [Candidatus Nanohalobium constans]QGA80759.1 30S ribosomal protein S8e [Candidatus Nanohalobium constans]
MAVWQDNSTTKKTGGKTRKYRKHKKHQKGGEFSEPQTGETTTIKKRTRGGNQKTVAKSSDTANVAADGEVVEAEIESVEENPANKNFVRRSLLTKGTVIQTSEGKAEVTSRPGQDGVVNAKLIE